LCERFGVPQHRLSLPIGVASSDALFGVLETLSGRATPAKHADERGRLIDAFVDGHKYLFDRRAVVFGEEDLVVGVVGLLRELGVRPVLCASGGESGRFRAAVEAQAPELASEIQVCQATDFAELEDRAAGLRPDLLIGNSKGTCIGAKRRRGDCGSGSRTRSAN
jgi:nitrogenase molybdenum-iron protein NifN